MTKVAVGALTGAALDWAVSCAIREYRPVSVPKYSTDWAQGGPIIERERIGLSWVASNYFNVMGCWSAHIPQTNRKLFYASTPLIAAMRCYVASKLGDLIEISEELSRNVLKN